MLFPKRGRAIASMEIGPDPFLAPGFIGAVMPENALGAGGVVLRARIEDFLAVDASQRNEFAGMSGWAGPPFTQL
jgi:hypothetical protein